MDRARLHLLQVEDNADDVFLFQLAVERTGLPIKLAVAFTAEQALRFLLSSPSPPLEKLPDLIICDIRMPRMSGLELVEIIKSHKRMNHVPIILCTTLVEESDRRWAAELGVSGYVLKSGRLQEVQEFIATLYASWGRGEAPNLWPVHPRAEDSKQRLRTDAERVCRFQSQVA